MELPSPYSTLLGQIWSDSYLSVMEQKVGLVYFFYIFLSEGSIEWNAETFLMFDITLLE